jgi:hypothetical protein
MKKLKFLKKEDKIKTLTEMWGFFIFIIDVQSNKKNIERRI